MTPTLDKLRAEAASCQACDLWRTGTQTVFGEGRGSAEVMMVGEQPGDREDIEGHPFVGPAGRVLDDALERVGIDRDLVYLTNVVKHFKWRPRGKRRIHQKPNAEEIRACRRWLDGELEAVHPRVLVCLGSVAAQALLGRQFRVTRELFECRLFVKLFHFDKDGAAFDDGEPVGRSFFAKMNHAVSDF